MNDEDFDSEDEREKEEGTWWTPLYKITVNKQEDIKYLQIFQVDFYCFVGSNCRWIFRLLLLHFLSLLLWFCSSLLDFLSLVQKVPIIPKNSFHTENCFWIVLIINQYPDHRGPRKLSHLQFWLRPNWEVWRSGPEFHREIGETAL